MIDLLYHFFDFFSLDFMPYWLPILVLLFVTVILSFFARRRRYK